MLRLKNVYPLLIMGIFLLGCQEDLLETIPNDRISSEIFWKNETDAILGANSVYPTLDGLNIVTYDGITDILHTNRLFQLDADIERGFMSANNPRFLNEWNSAYAGIRKANDFLDNVDRVQTSNSALINRLKGEVMTIRAYHYTKLAMLFGDVPLITEGISIEESKDLTRTPLNEIWDFVAAEFTIAAGYLPVSYGGADSGRITKGAANALKARAMLFAGRFPQAIEAAELVIISGAYSLYPFYDKLFTYEGENNSEVILDKQHVRDFYNLNIYTVLAPWSLIGGSNGSEYVPTKKMVDLYEMKNGLNITDPESGFDPYNPYINRDPRLKYSIFVTGSLLPNGKVYNTIPGDPKSTDPVGGTLFATSTGFNVKKYVAEEDLANRGNSGLNIMLIRFAEVLLTYAEAKIELNNIDQSVYNAINAVRTRPDVNMPEIGIGYSQANLREIVRKERTIELAFEGLRLYDIRRWKNADEVMQGVVKGMTYEKDGQLKTIEISGFERFFNPSRDYLWAIPQRERELNPNLTQNPNW